MTGEFSDKQSVVDLVHLCALHGVEHAVISPGSRNAPLSITFHRHPDITTHVVPDERVAGFVALGMAQQTGKPVVLCCTSGSAALNYAPALAEAFYQRIPLLVVTADRPVEFVDQGDGQTIRQRNVYENYIRGSFELIQDAAAENEVLQNRHTIEKALLQCNLPVSGPVHINFPLSEPLYNLANWSAAQLPQRKLAKSESPSSLQLANMPDRLSQANRVLVICGLIPPSDKLNQLLAQLAQNRQVAVLTESTSNLNHELFFPCIDRLIFTFDREDIEQFKPDLLITFGVQIISKRIKAILRQHKPAAHWHVDTDPQHPDTFQCLSRSVFAEPEHFLEKLLPEIKDNSASNYAQWLRDRDRAIDREHRVFIESAPFSDLLAVNALLNHLSTDYNLHIGNSASVRYVQLFKHGRTHHCNANRGTSGIDGCNSTAIGAAMLNNNPTLLLTGDMAFLYDSNAFWQENLPANLKIVVLNNGGGGIFRIIEGPSEAEELERYFEAKHTMTAEKVAAMYNLPYHVAAMSGELDAALPAFLSGNTDRPAILDIFTPRLENAPVLKAYFRQLQKARMTQN